MHLIAVLKLGIVRLFAFLLDVFRFAFRHGGAALFAATVLDYLEATGDRVRAEAWFAKYGAVPPDLAAALAKTADIPVDIEPVFSFGD